MKAKHIDVKLQVILAVLNESLDGTHAYLSTLDITDPEYPEVLKEYNRIERANAYFYQLFTEVDDNKSSCVSCVGCNGCGSDVVNINNKVDSKVFDDAFDRGEDLSQYLDTKTKRVNKLIGDKE